MNTIPQSKKEFLKEHIDKMSTNEHKQIFNIIQKYTDQITKTQNGILVSSSVLNNECLNEIDKYVVFSIDQQKRIEEDAKTRKNYERLVHD
jgi:CRISPR-associated protein Cas8b1/Cst1 subtype I-B